MDWLCLFIGLLTGMGITAGIVVTRQRHDSAFPPHIRWGNILVPMLIAEGLKLDVPLAALNAAFELSTGRVTFYTFVEVPRTQSLSAPLAAETEISLRLLEAAEDVARQRGRTLEGGIQRVRDYGYGVVEAIRQLEAKAVVLEVAATPHRPEQRGELGSSLRQPNPGALITLVHDRNSCDVLVVASNC